MLEMLSYTEHLFLQGKTLVFILYNKRRYHSLSADQLPDFDRY